MNIKILTGAALIALFVASCSFEENIPKLQLAEQELTITATREGDETLTRTYRDDADGSIWWVPGDAISLFYGGGTNGGSKFTSVNTTDTTKVTNFTGVINAISGGGEVSMEQTYFWGLYPYQEDASCDGSSITMTLPKQQTAVPGTVATNTFPSIGRSQGIVMGFYNICSGMKFSVTKEGVKKVTLKSRNGEPISGKAKVSFGEDGLPVTQIIDGLDEVVLKAPAGESFEPGKFYFLVMFPTTFTKGFNVTLETLSEEATYEKTGSLTAKRSKFGKIENIDANVDYSSKGNSIPIEDPNFKAYLVENFDKDSDGEISYEEASNIARINVYTDNIESVQGIEFMENLDSLRCYGMRSSGSYGALRDLDVSNNRKLTWLSCDYNQLTTLDVSNNTALTKLYCSENQLTSLNISNNTALTHLYCFSNQLTSLDVSKNTALTYLDCSPMSGALASLYICNNQEIPNVTIDRNVSYIPEETVIVIKPDNGGGEGTGEDDWGDGN